MTMYIPRLDREERLLEGVVDLHCHAGPCVYGKDFDEVETAQMMRSAGYRGVLFKQHLIGANRIHFVRKAVPGLEIYGGIALNHYVGGLNPFAVAATIIFGGKEVKFPNLHAAHHMQVFGTPTYAHIAPTAGQAMEARLADMVTGITIFDENQSLRPEVLEILSLVADADIGVETGHLSPDESFALVRAARGANVKKIWQTHGNWWKLYQYTPQQLSEIADAGALIELTANFALSSTANETSNEGAEYTARIIKEVGAHRCILASDYGTVGRYNPVEGMRVLMRTMIRLGIPREDVDLMAKDNPARMLGI